MMVLEKNERYATFVYIRIVKHNLNRGEESIAISFNVSIHFQFQVKVNKTRRLCVNII